MPRGVYTYCKYVPMRYFLRTCTSGFVDRRESLRVKYQGANKYLLFHTNELSTGTLEYSNEARKSPNFVASEKVQYVVMFKIQARSLIGAPPQGQSLITIDRQV